ncbi:MAG: Arginine-tRNA ligase [Parcubacteria group bacterium GW2011_GWA2_36_10]|nr:MAG: Arginine-tRNA ligase [Parcubacteria group bacterium GW2011_GWA2_36_10]
MTTLEQIKANLKKQIDLAFQLDWPINQLDLDLPPNENLGDYAFACFELAKFLKQNPVEVAKTLSEKFQADDLISQVEFAGPYLNLKLATENFVKNALAEINSQTNFGYHDFGKKQKIMIEFSGPNTNKPQHLGHVRNDILGQTLVNLYRACDFEVIPVNIINDRGIHIIKSMLAWQKWANNETPETSQTKGDHFVGIYYVMFEQALKAEKNEYLAKNKLDYQKLEELAQRKVDNEFLAQSPLMQAAHAMLIKWEANDPAVRDLWKTMNNWVYAGFAETYKNLGVSFDKVYYESETYLLGKDLVKIGLEKNVFFKKEDGSIWIDLTADKLDEKLVLRADGTSVYITQDLGTAKNRFDEFEFDKMIYVVANEQNYHFQVLFLTLKKLGFAWAENLHHLAYGMVNLPDGKMKSREGNVVDADNLIIEMEEKAKVIISQAEKQISHDQASIEEISQTVGLGALKFFILGVNPQKDMIFDPQASISFDGYTGPFVQYTHARIQNILNKANKKIDYNFSLDFKIEVSEKKLAKILLNFPETIKKSALEYNPSLVTQYLFELAKTFNNFYQLHSVLQTENKNQQNFRLNLCQVSAKVLKTGLGFLGIQAPDKM